MGVNEFDYVIVQAGGKGSRMLDLTKNKPKALVPVNNLPMIFHLFRLLPKKRFVIIGDYKIDVLEKYLAAFADVDYTIVSGAGNTGTCAGLGDALKEIPQSKRFMLVWCDLILPENFAVPPAEEDLIGVSKGFPCRWKYENGQFAEERSDDHGVAGLFVFNDKSAIEDVPQDGEFVRWLRDKGMKFGEYPLFRTKEYGLYSEWEKLPVMRCRPFNRVEIEGNRVSKTPIDEQGKQLALREVAWYKKVLESGFKSIPEIYSFEPLVMERIDGKNVYEYPDLPVEDKGRILKEIIEALDRIHAMESVPFDEDSYNEAYIDKTFKRLEKVRDLVPFANDKIVRINGKNCRNVFYLKDELLKIVWEYAPERFVLIHGDPTFSNIMLRKGKEPVFIDPRGYFGKTELYGDPAYDWVKLYYSLVSNYDKFNLKDFSLDIGEKEVFIKTGSNNWEAAEEYFWANVKGVTKKQIKILLAITWLSLTTYAWENYDSICGAFYIGLQYLEEALTDEQCL